MHGKPFFALGSQAKNSSGYSRQEPETAFAAVRAMHGNTLEKPVYWQQVEPVDDAYGFRSLSELLELADGYESKLMLLWFGTWKNGDMDCAPPWVKSDHMRFRWVIHRLGVPIWGLSPYGQATCDANTRAFSHLMAYFREHGTRRALIARQLENEPGTLWSDRSYGAQAEALFQASVPEQLIEASVSTPQSPVHAVR